MCPQAAVPAGGICQTLSGVTFQEVLLVLAVLKLHCLRVGRHGILLALLGKGGIEGGRVGQEWEKGNYLK